MGFSSTEWDPFFSSASFTSILHLFVLSWPPFVLFAVIHRYRWQFFTPLRKPLLLRNLYLLNDDSFCVVVFFLFTKSSEHNTVFTSTLLWAHSNFPPVYYRLIKIVFVRLPLSLTQSTYFLFPSYTSLLFSSIYIFPCWSFYSLS